MAQPILTGSAALTVRIGALVTLYTAFMVSFDPIALMIALIVYWLLLER